MSNGEAHLRRKLASAGDLRSVVRTMKALAASSISQYEDAVRALAAYDRTVELGLGVALRASGAEPTAAATSAVAEAPPIGAIVFGSDQGLVGQFNEVVVAFATKDLAARPGTPLVWVVGERVQAGLVDAGLTPAALFAVPSSVSAIAPLIGQLLVASEAHTGRGPAAELHLFYNRPVADAATAPTHQRLLPLDDAWRRQRVARPWPSAVLPEVLGEPTATLRALVREHLFISLFRACAGSLASENASRLAAMQRADKNIDELLETLQGDLARLRQGRIDEELFDVIAGFEALSRDGTTPHHPEDDP